MENRAMSLLHTREKCSLCNRSLARWDASTCARCGCKLCGHHTHLLRAPHSYVLVSVCDHCTKSVTAVHVQAQRPSHHAAHINS